MEILDTNYLKEMPGAYAGFWIRVGAYLIDTIIIYSVLFIVMAIFGISLFSMGNPDAFALSSVSLISFLLLILAAILYFPLMESSEKQGTIGKIAAGIKVGKADGSRISFANAFGRYFAKILSALILYFGFFMIAWDDKKQGLHDKLANTFVFYK